MRSDGAGLSGEIRITTGLLISGAAVLAVPDPGFVSLLVRRIKEAVFLRLKWPLGNAAAVVWYGLGMRYLARRAEWNPVLACCLIAGLLGPLTRVQAVFLGSLTKPPRVAGRLPVCSGLHRPVRKRILLVRDPRAGQQDRCHARRTAPGNSGITRRKAGMQQVEDGI